MSELRKSITWGFGFAIGATVAGLLISAFVAVGLVVASAIILLLAGG